MVLPRLNSMPIAYKVSQPAGDKYGQDTYRSGQQEGFHRFLRIVADELEEESEGVPNECISTCLDDVLQHSRYHTCCTVRW